MTAIPELQTPAALVDAARMVDGAEAVARFGREHGEAFEVWIEIDMDGHRSGIPPEGGALLDVGRALHEGGARLGGVMAHAGGSYALDTPEALQAAAEQERAGTVRAAERLREAGLPCPVMSVGSTPTALSAQSLDGVTEVRAGVYVFFDLVMHNIGVCTMDEIALSVLTTVIGHQQDKGWAIEGYLIESANQEHGIVARTGGMDPDIAARFPVGTGLRILPNHACATAAQFPAYSALLPGGVATWPRFQGW